MSLLIALAALSQPLDPVECGFLRFSRGASNRAPAPLAEQFCISQDRDARGDYLLRRTAIVRGSTVVTWAATRRCPAAKAQLSALENVQLPAPDVPGLGSDNNSISLDGISYRLEGPASFGDRSRASCCKATSIRRSHAGSKGWSRSSSRAGASGPTQPNPPAPPPTAR